MVCVGSCCYGGMGCVVWGYGRVSVVCVFCSSCFGFWFLVVSVYSVSVSVVLAVRLVWVGIWRRMVLAGVGWRVVPVSVLFWCCFGTVLVGL